MINHFFKNNVDIKLASPISSSLRIISVEDGKGELVGSNFPVRAILHEFDEEGKATKREIIEIISRDSDSLTVNRAIEACPTNDDAKTHTKTALQFSTEATLSIVATAEIFDEMFNQKVPKNRGLRTGLSSSETFIVSNGEEKIANILTTDIEDTDKFQLITENGNARNITFAEIKNKVNREYVTEIELAEATPELTSESFSEQFLPNIAQAYSVEELHKSSNVQYLLSGGAYRYQPSGSRQDNWVHIKLAESIKFTKLEFKYTTNIDHGGEGLLAVLMNGREVFAKAGTSVSQDTIATITNIPDEYINDIKIRMVSLGSQTSIFNIVGGLKFTGSKHRTAYYAISKAKKLEIKQNLPEEKTSSVTKNGVAFRFPFDINVTKIRTKSLASSNSAQVSILDGDSKAILASANAERGRQDFFFDYTLQANKEYFFVVDNSDNFGRKIGYQGDYRDKNPFFTGEVTNGNKGSNSKFWAFESIELDGQNKGYLSRAGFLDNFAGFAQAGKNIGEIIQIKDTENSYAHGFTGLVEGSSYYISPIAGLITSAAVLAGSHKKHIGVAITPTTLRLTSHE